jgi:hypothetical protein
MRKRRQLVASLQLALLALWTACSLHAYESLQGPTELLYWDKARAYPGYTWFGGRGTTYLLDLEGRVVHPWPIGTNPHLLTNGNVLDASKDDPSGFGGFTEVDWSGNIVWQHTGAATFCGPSGPRFAERRCAERRGGSTRRLMVVRARGKYE